MDLLNTIVETNKFDFLLERINEDTRLNVENDLIRDFDMFSWLFGRGFNGSYYAPSAIDSFHRNMIETGYLHMILKGGIFYLLCYVFILSKTAYMGLCKGNNSLSKLFGWYALAHLILLYPGGHIAFNLEFFILWMGVVFCNNPRLRNLHDVDVKRIIW